MRRLYIAAPYEDANHVRRVHAQLFLLGVDGTSTWAFGAKPGPEPSRTDEAYAAHAEQNDMDIILSDGVLVLAREGAGAEMFAEARYALTLSIPVWWVGRKCLTAYRPRVTRCETLQDAISMIAEWGKGQ